MNRVFGSILVATAILGWSPIAFGQTTQQVAPGVTWSHRPDNSKPLNVNILAADVSDPRITLETESGQDRLFVGEKVLSSVQREAEPGKTNILGGVNGDFWMSPSRKYIPIGLFVADGMIYNMPARRRSAFVFTEYEEPYIGIITINVGLETAAGRLKIDKINSVDLGKNDVVLYTPPFGNVSPAKGERYILDLEAPEFLPNKPVRATISKADANTTMALAPNRLVLDIPPSRVSEDKPLVAGDTGSLTASIPEVRGVVASVCGGGPALIKNGKIIEDFSAEGFGESFNTTRHPRTAIGFSQDKKTIYLVTVDGRQPDLSRGASLTEMAAIMKDVGCWEAMNLDGGGSTSMVVKDQVVNKPSDVGGPRTVANSILVVELINPVLNEKGIAVPAAELERSASGQQ